MEAEWKDFKPKTELVKELLETRQRAIKKGLQLLSIDEILELMRKRRESLDDEDYITHLEEKPARVTRFRLNE